MIDYYAILEISRNANSTEIRAAYKRMAMLYHPDRNAGDKEAEEKFKLINEAYHVLSDPLKKSRYDFGDTSNYEAILTEAYYRELRKRRYTQWKQAQQSRYRIDKNYYRIQGLAFLVFLIISGFCFTVIHTIDYFVQRQREQHWQHNSMLLKQVYALYNDGQFDEAFTMIRKLHDKDPIEFRFNFAHDSLVHVLKQKAEDEFLHKDFQRAVHHYSVLKNHEEPASLETIERLANCQYYLGEYTESLQSLKHVLNQQPWNLEVIYHIGTINLENLENYDEALQYFTLGKKLFKKNLSEVYGVAFELVMDPWDVPDVYYSIFLGRAKTNLMLKDYEEAITDSNWAVFLRRNRAEAYNMRVRVKIASHNITDLCPDLSMAKKLGDEQADKLLKKYCH